MTTHHGTRKIETERLILRQATMDDANAMFHNWASDPQVTKYLTWPAHGSPEVTKTVLQNWVSCYNNPDFYQWLIELKGSDLGPIGSISVVSCDDTKENAEIGYCIGRRWWHQGITSEALGAVIRYLFDQVGILHIEAKHDVNNPNSGAVMRKCGMMLQEIAPQAGRNNQGACDMVTYIISKTPNNSKRVHAVIDRPLGSFHPQHPDLHYEVNYGFIPGTKAPDGEDQDVYVLGIDHPIHEFWGQLIAIAHRQDDIEDKWIIAPEYCTYSKDDIAKMIAFQEKYFQTEIIML